MQTKDSQTIVSRFFQALYALKERKVIKGKKTFTDRYGINRWNLNTLEKNPASDIMQLGWLTHLVEDYNVSAEWLITGNGEILIENNMSNKNPTFIEILENAKSDNKYLRVQFGKSFKNIATADFLRKYGRKPTIEDSQEVYNLYEARWKDILTPEREAEDRRIGAKIIRKMFGSETTYMGCDRTGADGYAGSRGDSDRRYNK